MLRGPLDAKSDEGTFFTRKHHSSSVVSVFPLSWPPTSLTFGQAICWWWAIMHLPYLTTWVGYVQIKLKKERDTHMLNKGSRLRSIVFFLRYSWKQFAKLHACPHNNAQFVTSKSHLIEKFSAEIHSNDNFLNR